MDERNIGLLPFRVPEAGTSAKARLSARDKHFPEEACGTKVLFDDYQLRLATKYLKPGKQRRFNEVHSYLDTIRDEQYHKPFSRAYFVPDEFMGRLEKYAEAEAPNFTWNRHFQAAFGIVLGRYSNAHLRMLDINSDEDVRRLIRDEDTATGWTGIITGKKKKYEVVDGSFRQVQRIEEAAKQNHTFNLPYTLYRRTDGEDGIADDGTLTGEGVEYKTRPVWVDDVYRVISGNRAAKPLSEWYARGYNYVGHGKSDDALTLVFMQMRQYDGLWVESDYSKYDSTLPSWLLSAAFDIVRAAFDNLDVDLWEAWKHDFIHKSYWDPYQHCFITVHKGDPSGSAWTSIINDIAHELILETVHAAYRSKYGKTVTPTTLQPMYTVTGDDEVERVYFHTMEEARAYAKWKAKYISMNFGVLCKPSAVNIRDRYDNPKYLGRFWGQEGPYRCIEQLISHLLFPKEPREYARGKAKDWQVFLSYYIVSPMTMSAMFDMDKFKQDYHCSRLEVMNWKNEDLKELPYIVREWVLIAKGRKRECVGYVDNCADYSR